MSGKEGREGKRKGGVRGENEGERRKGEYEEDRRKEEREREEW